MGHDLQRRRQCGRKRFDESSCRGVVVVIRSVGLTNMLVEERDRILGDAA